MPRFFPRTKPLIAASWSNLSIPASAKLEKRTGPSPRAHALLGRALFVSFLHAREFIKPSYYPDGTTSLLDISAGRITRRSKRLLYKEFFPASKASSTGPCSTRPCGRRGQHREGPPRILAFFSAGMIWNPGRCRWVLGIRFPFIPVEIISAIYEEFMKDADPSSGGARRGAYYTPRHLAETTSSCRARGRYFGADGLAVLDPACGSGIFLVAMFNLIAEKWRREN